MNVKIRNGFDISPPDRTPDISIIIDVFRASTTSLAILEKQPVEYFITNDLDLIRNLIGNSYRLISEVYDLGIDNSPTLVRKHVSRGEKIVHKTTNLTTALEKNLLSTPMLICCFNNIDSVVEYLLENSYSSIEIIPEGKMKTQMEAPEDTLCAKVLANKLKKEYFEILEDADSLLVNLEEKRAQKNWPQHFVEDIKQAVQLNLSDIIPTITKIESNLFQVSSLK
ncbi:MAG: 2-phosphosulfolactate phosphatase [Bdellovibrionaceae bacterium]|nr:2-phosphosulfolactate phosphatase [Pseudobdellovibrionaceae bacterium]